ncbi:TPA: phage recombination protein Bet [Streptococcus agalactiae]
MTNDIQTAEKNFLENPQSLTSGIVRKYLDPQSKASDEELAYFIAQARVQNLNPFTREIYFIKYGNQPAQIVVALKAFQKKADAHPQYDGMDSGIIYEKDGEVQRSDGAFLPRGAEILGAWAIVYRKDRTHPIKAEVTFSEYDNSKIRKIGTTDQYGKPVKPNTWDEKPAVMIHKVALVTALRNAFPNELGGLYEADEMKEPKDITPQETQEEVRARKMAEIEQYKQEQAKKQIESIYDTSYPSNDISDHVEETGQGELFTDELEY